MCLIFIAYNCAPINRYVIAANRDEYRNRPTAPLDYRNPEKTILGGQDLQAGGMWLGVTKKGKIAAITNFRDGILAEPGQPSRGDIVYDFLRCTDSALHSIEALSKKAHNYSGFNVLFGDQKDLVYYSNRQNKVKLLTPGFYGLSNHLLDSPWPKVRRGKEMLYDQMCSAKVVDAKRITELLKDSEVPADEFLPDTGVGLSLERFLGTIFIDGVDYGTRSSAVVVMGRKGDVTFTETSYLHGPDFTNKLPQLSMGFNLGR